MIVMLEVVGRILKQDSEVEQERQTSSLSIQKQFAEGKKSKKGQKNESTGRSKAGLINNMAESEQANWNVY